MHPYSELVGPFYSTPPARTHVLQVVTSDGRTLYPEWQFKIDITGPLVVLNEAGVDGWTVALWFSTPNMSLGGRTPREWLSDPALDTGPVIASALEWMRALDT